MTLIEIGSIKDLIANTAIEGLAVFTRKLTDLTQLDMTVLYKVCESRLGREAGKKLFKSLILEVQREHVLGLIPDCPAATFTLPTPRLSIGELRRILMRFELVERQLIVFALSAQMTLTEAAFLQRKNIKAESNINKWTNELKRFVNSMPAHISCQYVFWDFDKNNRPTPLVGFEAKFRSVVKASWPVFAKLCEDLIPVDTHEDAKEFATMFVLEASN